MKIKRNQNPNQEGGFTIIELMLAMAYLASILLFTTLVIVQVLSLYNKGLALKQINQATRSLTEDVTRVSNSGRTANFISGDGYLCIGTTAYLWNTVDKFDSGVNQYRLDSPGGAPISLVKTNSGIDAQSVEVDPSKGNANNYCQVAPTGNMVVDSSTVTSLVGDNVRVLGFSLFQGNAGLARLKLSLGTYNEALGNDVTPTLDVNTGRWNCEGNVLGDFCAAGNFETIVYVPNE